MKVARRRITQAPVDGSRVGTPVGAKSATVRVTMTMAWIVGGKAAKQLVSDLSLTEPLSASPRRGSRGGRACLPSGPVAATQATTAVQTTGPGHPQSSQEAQESDHPTRPTKPHLGRRPDLPSGNRSARTRRPRSRHSSEPVPGRDAGKKHDCRSACLARSVRTIRTAQILPNGQREHLLVASPDRGTLGSGRSPSTERPFLSLAERANRTLLRDD